MPAILRTRDGQALRVLFPGQANAGAGPDFTGALLSFNDGPGGARRCRTAPQGVLVDRSRPSPGSTLCRRDPARGAAGRRRAGPNRSRPSDPGAGPWSFAGICRRWAGSRYPRPAHACTLRRRGPLRQWSRPRCGRRASRDSPREPPAGKESLPPVPWRIACSRPCSGRRGLAGTGRRTRHWRQRWTVQPLRRLLTSLAEDRHVLALAVLLGMAGLLEQAHADEATRAAWGRHRFDWPGRPLDARQWQRFRLRPSNLPEARLRLLATLLATHGLHGFLQAMIDLVDRDSSGSRARAGSAAHARGSRRGPLMGAGGMDQRVAAAAGRLCPGHGPHHAGRARQRALRRPPRGRRQSSVNPHADDHRAAGAAPPGRLTSKACWKSGRASAAHSRAPPAHWRQRGKEYPSNRKAQATGKSRLRTWQIAWLISYHPRRGPSAFQPPRSRKNSTTWARSSSPAMTSMKVTRCIG